MSHHIPDYSLLVMGLHLQFLGSDALRLEKIGALIFSYPRTQSFALTVAHSRSALQYYLAPLLGSRTLLKIKLKDESLAMVENQQGAGVGSC